MKRIIICVIIFALLPLLSACSIGRTQTAVRETEAEAKYSFIGKKVSPFEVTDIDGNKISNEIFSRKKMTMNVFWSPNCVPCIEEMEALDKLYDLEGTMDIKLVSICVEGKLKDIQDLKRNYKMAYPIVMLKDQSLMDECTKDFEFIPFVIFVDENGKYLKEYLVGSRSYEEYLDHIEKLMEKL